MEDNDDDDLSQFSSLKLVANFRRKTRADHFLHLMPNDSLISPEQFLEEDMFFHKIYIIGTCPGDENTTPRLLFSIPFDPEATDDLSMFCFPHNTRLGKQKMNVPADFISYALTEPTIQYFSLYFPAKDEAPYFFCGKVTTNPFTLPSICHDMTAAEIFNLVTPEYMETSEICIVIQTRFPYYDLYYDLIHWIIQSETIGKYVLTSSIDHFLQTRKYEPMPGIEQLWPESHRVKLSAALESVLQRTLSVNAEHIIVDFPPFPTFEWKKPESRRQELPLVLYCLDTVVSRLSVDHYLDLLTALLLERSILIYYPDITILSRFILGLHLMLWPLKWVVPSITVLPEQLYEILESPSPIMVGLDRPFLHSFPNLVKSQSRSKLSKPKHVLTPKRKVRVKSDAENFVQYLPKSASYHLTPQNDILPPTPNSKVTPKPKTVSRPNIPPKPKTNMNNQDISNNFDQNISINVFETDKKNQNENVENMEINENQSINFDLLSNKSIFYVNILDEFIYSVSKLPLLPSRSLLKSRLDEYWEKFHHAKTQKEKDDALRLIVISTNLTVKDIITPAQVSLIAEYSQDGCTGTRFIPELYLKNYKTEERVFANQMSSSQMFQFFIEGECRAKTSQFTCSMDTKI